jgi:DNA-directed RNA polymerase specialized sigma24 family protein
MVLVALLLFFLWKMKSMSKMLTASQEEEKAAASHLTKLSDQLNLLESKRLSLEETFGQLTEKVTKDQQASSRLASSEIYNSTMPKPRGASLRLQVEDLHLQGFSLAEIAQRLRLHPTEVKMALDLGRLKAD